MRFRLDAAFASSPNQLVIRSVLCCSAESKIDRVLCQFTAIGAISWIEFALVTILLAYTAFQVHTGRRAFGSLKASFRCRCVSFHFFRA